MLKYLIQLIVVYALLQYVFKVDLNKMIAPYLGPVTQLIDNNDISLDSLSESLIEGDISSILEGANAEQLQKMLNGQDLESLLQDKNLTAEDAQAKIAEMKEKLQDKLDLLKNQ